MNTEIINEKTKYYYLEHFRGKKINLVVVGQRTRDSWKRKGITDRPFEFFECIISNGGGVSFVSTGDTLEDCKKNAARDIEMQENWATK